jgi:hypothetical protein
MLHLEEERRPLNPEIAEAQILVNVVIELPGNESQPGQIPEK